MMRAVDFLVTFLRARLDEDERLAQQGKPIPPDRILRDVEAKRRIIDELNRRLRRAAGRRAAYGGRRAAGGGRRAAGGGKIHRCGRSGSLQRHQSSSLTDHDTRRVTGGATHRCLRRVEKVSP
jgi:hypothetical protein